MATVVASSAAAATIRCSTKRVNARGFPSVLCRKLHQFQPSILQLIPRNSDKHSLDFSNLPFSRYLSSGTGRSRKRPRPWQRNRKETGSISLSAAEPSRAERTTSTDHDLPPTNDVKTNAESSSDDSSLPYPKGKPWRVLWPRPHGIPNEPSVSIWELHKRIPTREQLQKGWTLYKETWEDGITGIPTKRKQTASAAGGGVGEKDSSESPPILTRDQLHEIGDNATKNMKIVRQDAQELLEQAKDTTGIRTQDDLKALASEAMKVATECIREFMAGYRSGRDSEIDKMLHEYFQDEEQNENKHSAGEKESSGDKVEGGDDGKQIQNDNTVAKTERKKKRKPKRGIPRS